MAASNCFFAQYLIAYSCSFIFACRASDSPVGIFFWGGCLRAARDGRGPAYFGVGSNLGSQGSFAVELLAI